jgi:hypothetical protein
MRNEPGTADKSGAGAETTRLRRENATLNLDDATFQHKFEYPQVRSKLLSVGMLPTFHLQ